MKKTLAALGLTASLGAYAAVPTGSAPFQIVVPNLKSGLEITLEGLYLQPSNSDFDYGVSAFNPSSSTSSDVLKDTTAAYVSPDYNLGFRVGLGYVFPNSGNDIQAAWTYFGRSDGDNTSIVPAPYPGSGATWVTRGGESVSIAAPVTAEGGTTFFSAHGNTSFTYNAADLDVGQYLNIGTRLTTRLFAGLRYAQVKSNLSDNFSYLNTFPPLSLIDTSAYNESLNSKFNGIGPRMGLDTAYNVAQCFGLVGHFSAALLIGQVDTNTQSYIATSNSVEGELVTAVQTTSINSIDSNRVVPAFDAKVGVDYSLPLHNDAQRLTVEAGWQATHYYHVVDRLALQGTRATSNIGLQGPYLSLNVKL